MSVTPAKNCIFLLVIVWLRMNITAPNEQCNPLNFSWNIGYVCHNLQWQQGLRTTCHESVTKELQIIIVWNHTDILTIKAFKKPFLVFEMILNGERSYKRNVVADREHKDWPMEKNQASSNYQNEVLHRV